MISEVPLGAFLSGGVDSSAVVAMMAGLSARPGDHLLDLVRRSGVQRIGLRADGGGPLPARATTWSRSTRTTSAWWTGWPRSTTSRMPTARRSRPTACASWRARRVTVALSGDGGDENFGGYRRYRWHMNEERVRSLLPLAVAPAGVRAARPALSQGGLGAARVPRQVHVRGAGARLGGGLFPQRVDPARRHARASCSATRFRSELQGYARGRGAASATPRARPPTTRCR